MQGVRAHLDIDVTGLTVTEAHGITINCQGGASTVSKLYGLSIEHESVSGAGATMTAAIHVKSVNGVEPITTLIDASEAIISVHDTDQVALLKFKISGTTKTLSWDLSSSVWVSS